MVCVSQPIFDRPAAAKAPAPLRSVRIQPDQSRRLLLMIRPPRPTLAEVPLAGLSVFILGYLCYESATGGRLQRTAKAFFRAVVRDCSF